MIWWPSPRTQSQACSSSFQVFIWACAEGSLPSLKKMGKAGGAAADDLNSLRTQPRSQKKVQKRGRIYSNQNSLVVTHPTTNWSIWRLYRAERMVGSSPYSLTPTNPHRCFCSSRTWWRGETEGDFHGVSKVKRWNQGHQTINNRRCIVRWLT